MKFTTRQANLLANKVAEKLKDSNFSVSAMKRKEIEKWVATYQRLRQAHEAAEKAQSKHFGTLSDITGLDKYYGTTTTDNIVKEMQKRAIPSVNIIEDEIVLSSMFAEDQDLDSFIDSIVKKLTPKKKLLVKQTI